MTSSAATIIDEVRAAFPARRQMRFSPMANSRQGDEPAMVETDFADKDDWTALDPAWLDATPDGFGSALSFLSDEAIRFYIPAYMTADLMGGLHTADPAFALVHGFDDMSRDQRIWPRKEDTWTDFARARWDGLTREQAAAVARYLEWRVERDSLTVAYNIAEALTAYWYARAADHSTSP